MRAVEHLELSDTDVGPLAAVVAELAARGGWVNLDPEVDPDDLRPARGVLGALLSGRGPDVPRATWVAASEREPATIGVQHGSGARARDVLPRYGLALPEGSAIVQDHPRRGLVVHVGDGDLVTMLEWLLAAATALSAVELTGAWRAEIHRRAPD